MDILHLSGAIYLGDRSSELIRESKRAAILHKLEYTSLSREEIRSQYAQFLVPNSYVGLWERDAGYIFAEKAVEAIAGLAIKNGAELHGIEKVINWDSNSNGVTVTTNLSSYSASKLVICSGAWTSLIVGDLGIKLTVTRQALGWTQPLKPDLFMPDRFLPFAVANSSGSLHYGFPILPGALGMKSASHVIGEVIEPELVDRQPNPNDIESFLPFLQSTIPDAAGQVLDMRICMYTNSPDSHFILDNHPNKPNVTFGCGFSGHGFKFAPVIGEALRDLAVEGKSGLPIEFLSLARFKKSYQ
jgi:sarcosine oxidase